MAIYPDDFVGPIPPGSYRYSAPKPALDATRAAIPAGQANSPWVQPTSQPSPQSPATPSVAPTPNPMPGYNDPIKSYFEGLNKTLPTEADNQATRETIRKEMQATIDAINAKYTNLIAKQEIQNQDALGQTRAINARSGLMGSDFGQTNEIKTKEYNAQQIKALEDERALMLSSVNQKVDERAQAAIEAKKQEALGNQKAYLDYLSKAQEEARNELTMLAGKGVNLESLNPAQRQKLFEQAGYDSAWGEIIYNAQKPKSAQIDYKFEKLAEGVGLFYGVDPATGELKQQKVQVEVPDGFSLTIAPDGTPLIFNKSTGEASVASGFGQGSFAKPESPKTNIVSINGSDYVVDEYGNYSNPAVPQETAKANELKNSALSAAQTLLDKVNNGQGTTAVGGTRLWGLGGVTSRIPGTGPANFVNDFNNLKSLLSLDNVKYLKGQGAVSDAERELLANAASKLNLAQSDAEFKKTLEDLVMSLSGTGQGLNYSDPQVKTLKDAGFNDEEIRAALNLTDVGGDTNSATKYATGQKGKLVSSNPYVIDGFDIRSYATDPTHEQKVDTIFKKVARLTGADQITNYIKATNPKSPITGNMVLAAAKEYNVSPQLMIALMQQDSNFGTAGKAVRTKNPGNVGNTDSGATRSFGSWDEGVKAVAQNLSKRRIA